MSTNFDAIDLGTVAMVKNQYGVWNRCILTFHPSDNNDFGFAWRPGIADTYYTSDEFRRLIVIDPEDMAEVERFREIASRWADRVPYADAREEGDLTYGDAMQAALKEYANPTPPVDEPKGLGAVVESFEGSVWVRGHHNNKQPWVRTAFNETRSWDEIPTPLTVLSEGYIPEAKS